MTYYVYLCQSKVRSKVKLFFMHIHYESRDTVPVQGEEGLLAGLSAGKVWIDHSTTDYEQARRYDFLLYKSTVA